MTGTGVMNPADYTQPVFGEVTRTVQVLVTRQGLLTSGGTVLGQMGDTGVNAVLEKWELTQPELLAVLALHLVNEATPTVRFPPLAEPNEIMRAAVPARYVDGLCMFLAVNRWSVPVSGRIVSLRCDTEEATLADDERRRTGHHPNIIAGDRVSEGTPLLSADDMKDGGYLAEVNRRFFHPLGLALAMEWAEGAGPKPAWLKVLDSRADPEGFCFGADLIDKIVPKAAAVEAVEAVRRPARQAALGYWIQPLPAAVPVT